MSNSDCKHKLLIDTLILDNNINRSVVISGHCAYCYNKIDLSDFLSSLQYQIDSLEQKINSITVQDVMYNTSKEINGPENKPR